MKKIQNSTNYLLFLVAFCANLVGAIYFLFLKQYGLVLFLTLPFFIGFFSVFFVQKKKIISQLQAIQIGLITLLIASLMTLLFALEGVLCILMASPLLVLLTMLGSFTAWKIHNKKSKIIPLLFFIGLSSLSFDSLSKTNQMRVVTTKIRINAPIETVWNHVIVFGTIAPPESMLFKTGISYPINAQIKGKGVGAVRYCNFTTGSFVEPITTWKEPYLLQFGVLKQPTPMIETNPFWEIQPAHLNGYFQSKKGQFLLKKIDENQTEIQGTTYYVINLQPEIYWRAWSDMILHKIHLRVLEHIKKESELGV